MPPNPLDLVWRSSEIEIPVFVDGEIVTWTGGSFEILAAIGVLREWTTATHAACTACGGEHVEEVILLRYPDGTVRFFIDCPDHGRIEIEKGRLLQWTISFDPIIESLRKGLCASGDVIEVVPSRLWSIGRSTLAGRSRVVWAGRGMSWPDAMSLAGKVPTGSSPVLLHFGRPPVHGLVALRPESVIDLAPVVSLVNGELIIDRAAIEDQLSSGHADPKTKPAKRRATRATAIDALEQALIEHIISARDHAHSEDQRGRSAELLPRPSQKQLAQQLDLSRSAVSRAFNDSNAHTLRMLWALADDLERVMEYRRHS